MGFGFLGTHLCPHFGFEHLYFGNEFAGILTSLSSRSFDIVLLLFGMVRLTVVWFGDKKLTQAVRARCKPYGRQMHLEPLSAFWACYTGMPVPLFFQI